MVVLAKVGRYPMVVKAAKYLCNFWNRLVEMVDEQAFLQSAVLGPLILSNSTHKSWAGQVVSFLATLGMHALRSHYSTVSECQCCCGEAGE